MDNKIIGAYWFELKEKNKKNVQKKKKATEKIFGGNIKKKKKRLNNLKLTFELNETEK